jgi:ABC-type nickel/cobalt efflux system permease component RcnA
MSLGSGLTALLIGMFILIIGMYTWASVAGTFAFFIGFALAIAGAAVLFAQARHRRAR